MGIFSHEKTFASSSTLRAGLTSGFCGVLTSYSGWVYSSLKQSADNAASDILCGLSLPFMAYIVGRDVCNILGEEISKSFSYGLGILLLLSPVIIYPLLPSLFDMSTILFAIAGCLARFAFTKILNNDIFPFGTLLSNLIACVVVILLSENAAVKDGFCGGLSTVSLFVHEIFTLRTNGHTLKLWLYLLSSLGACAAILVIIDAFR